jgi:phosphoribosylanthranilate isomerase
LHGNETPEQVSVLKEKFPQIAVIKAFSIAIPDDFDRTKDYTSVCDFFLFDTKTPQYGGSGKSFDWKMIEACQEKTPFFLSGGISAEDADKIREIQHPALYGVDLNSRFELSAGIKNVDLLRTFIETLKR